MNLPQPSSPTILDENKVPPADSHGWRSVRALLVGIVLAIAVGVTFGETMWKASGSAERRLKKLEDQREKLASLLERDPPNPDAGSGKELQSQLKQLDHAIMSLRQELADATASSAILAKIGAAILRLVGELYLRLLMLIVLPLVATSIICGLRSLGTIRKLGNLGIWTLVYYTTTTGVAVGIGLFLTQTLVPGRAAGDLMAWSMPAVHPDASSRSLLQTMLEAIRGIPGNSGGGLVPANIVAAAADTNVLGVIFFSILIGLGATAAGSAAEPLIRVVEAANEVLMRVVRGLVALAPVGVFGLIASQLVENGGHRAVTGELMKLGWFAGTVVGGLTIHFVLLSLIGWIFGASPPGKTLPTFAPALVTAFGTSSSSVTLPVTLECAARHRISRDTAGFVLPLGATINMDGTALYEAAAALFIAQAAGVPLGGVELVIVFVLATLAAVGAPGIPNAGLVTLLLVLNAVKLPASGIGTLLAIDWFLDRCRTMVNVYGDVVGATVIDRWIAHPSKGAACG